MRRLLILNQRDILHPNAGGAEVNLFEVTRRLVSRGYRATLLCETFPGGRREEILDGIDIVRLGRGANYYLRVPQAVRRLVAADPDIVVIEHLCKLPFFTPLYVRRPVIAVTHHLFGRTTFWQVSPPIAAAVLAAERLIPLVYRRCQFVAVSPSTRDDLLRRGIDGRRIRIIPNGVDSEHYAPIAADTSGPPTLLAFGRIEPYKRFDLALRAFARIRAEIPQARLRVVGGGTGLEALRAEVRRLHLQDSVSLTGPVEERDKLDSIRHCRLVLNSSEKEGWGLTVLEAAACARPTIASDVPGLRDAVLNGRTGVLVPHGDVEAMANAALALLRDPSACAALGRHARAWAERFSWDGVAEATAHVIEETCGAPASSSTPAWFAEPVEVKSADRPIPEGSWT